MPGGRAFTDWGADVSEQNDPTQPPEAAAPDIRGAISHSLQAAAALVGNSHVVEFFEGMVGRIVEDRFPIDAGGLIQAKCRRDVADAISKLLQ